MNECYACGEDIEAGEASSVTGAGSCSVSIAQWTWTGVFSARRAKRRRAPNDRLPGARLADKMTNAAKIDLVIGEAEARDGLVSMMQDRAACGEWPIPESPEDMLAWFEDEAKIQDDSAGFFSQRGNNEDSNVHSRFARAIRETCLQLRNLGVKPSVLPWDRKG